MDIFTHVSSMTGILNRNTVMNESQSVNESISSFAIPGYEGAISVMAPGYRFKSSLAFAFEKEFAIYHRWNPRENMLTLIRNALAQAAVVLPAVNKIIGGFTGTHIAKDALDAKQASAIQLLEYMDFLSTASMRFLQALYMAEGEAARTGGITNIKLAPAELMWLDDARANFVKVVLFFQEPGNKIIDRLNKASTVQLSRIDVSANAALSGNRLDTVGLGFLPPSISIALRIGESWNTFAHERYREQKDLKDFYELSLIELKASLNKGEADASTQKRIGFLNKRITSLREDQAAYEASVRG